MLGRVLNVWLALLMESCRCTSLLLMDTSLHVYYSMSLDGGIMF